MKKIIYLLLILLLLFSCNNEEEIIIDENLSEENEKFFPYGKKYAMCISEKRVKGFTSKTIYVYKWEIQSYIAQGARMGSCEDKYTYVPDDDFEAYLIFQGYDDFMDDYVLTSTIASVEAMDFSAGEEGGWWDEENPGRCFYDLTGIEDFASLESLIIDHTCTQKLDLSKNSNLTSLSIRYTDIESLILPQENSSLRGMYLYGFPIANLDLSTTLKLEYIDLISLRNLTSLDFSQNKYLDFIVARFLPNLNSMNLKNGTNSQIRGADINIDNVPNLNCISVDDVNHSRAHWPYVASHIQYTNLMVCLPPIDIDWPPIDFNL